MDANRIFLIIQLLLFLLLLSSLITGDVYLTYMIFNAKSYACEGFENVITTQAASTLAATTQAASTLAATTQAATTLAATTQAATTLAATTQAATTQAATTQAATTIAATTQAATTTAALKQAPAAGTKQYPSCYPLSKTELGFARFKVVMFWLLFTGISLAAMFFIKKKLGNNGIVFGIAISATFIMCIFILVGGIFMTQYAFIGDNKSCLTGGGKSTQHCYNLNNVEIEFAKISVIFGWLYTFIAIAGIGLYIWDANVG
jgi:hypothetical protein